MKNYAFDPPFKITENIFLGNKDDSRNLIKLKNLGIKHILVCGIGLKIYHPLDFVYRKLFIYDNPEENINKHFKDNYDFIKNCIKNKGKVLIHCYAGVSRSSTCIIAFLIKENNYIYHEAFNIVRSKKWSIYPNSGFLNQLKDYEVSLNKQKQKPKF